MKNERILHIKTHKSRTPLHKIYSDSLNSKASFASVSSVTPSAKNSKFNSCYSIYYSDFATAQFPNKTNSNIKQSKRNVFKSNVVQSEFEGIRYLTSSVKPTINNSVGKSETAASDQKALSNTTKLSLEETSMSEGSNKVSLKRRLINQNSTIELQENAEINNLYKRKLFKIQEQIIFKKIKENIEIISNRKLLSKNNLKNEIRNNFNKSCILVDTTKRVPSRFKKICDIKVHQISIKLKLNDLISKWKTKNESKLLLKHEKKLSIRKILFNEYKENLDIKEYFTLREPQPVKNLTNSNDENSFFKELIENTLMFSFTQDKNNMNKENSDSSSFDDYAKLEKKAKKNCI